MTVLCQSYGHFCCRPYEWEVKYWCFWGFFDTRILKTLSMPEMTTTAQKWIFVDFLRQESICILFNDLITKYGHLGEKFQKIKFGTKSQALKKLVFLFHFLNFAHWISYLEGIIYYLMIFSVDTSICGLFSFGPQCCATY